MKVGFLTYMCVAIDSNSNIQFSPVVIVKLEKRSVKILK